MKNKKVILILLFTISTFLYAFSEENYKAFTVNKTEEIQQIIETELFGKADFSSTLVLLSMKGGTAFDYYFYKVCEDNISLGIESSNNLEDNAVIYINTQKACGSTCKVYLDEPEEKQIFYVWEPFEKTISDTAKEKIMIKTNKGTYSIYVRTGITNLELFFEGPVKIKSIKGLEKFPDLYNLTFSGIK